MMKSPLKIIAPAAAILAIATSLPASAGNASGKSYTTSAVQYSDLNLASADGQKTLRNRISGAVSKVCRAAGTTSLRERMDARKCADAAAKRAKKSADIVIARYNNGNRFANSFSPVVAGN